MQFANVNGEAARFNASGDMLLGKTTADIAVSGIELNNSGIVVATNASQAAARFNRTGSDGQLVDFRNDGVTVGAVVVTGSTTVYNTTSDERLKDNIRDYTSGLDDCRKLITKLYHMKADLSKTDVVGFIAQQILKDFPHLGHLVSKIRNEDSCPVNIEIDETATLIKSLKHTHKAIVAQVESSDAVILSCSAELKGFSDKQLESLKETHLQDEENIQLETIYKVYKDAYSSLKLRSDRAIATKESAIKQLDSNDYPAMIEAEEAKLEALKEALPAAIEDMDYTLMLDLSKFVPMLAAGINDIADTQDSILERLAKLEGK